MSTNRHQPALLGGLFIGVLSALPIISIGNCCCLWVISGGVLVAYLQQKRQEAPIDAAGVLLGGVIAGALGALIAFVLDTIFLALLQPIMGPWQREMMQKIMDSIPNLPADARERMQTSSAEGAVMAVRFMGLFVSVPVKACFAALGALLGMAIFKKKTPAGVQG